MRWENEVFGTGPVCVPELRLPPRVMGDPHSNAFRFAAAANLDAAGGSMFPADSAYNPTDHLKSRLA
jgi:hypothetical protein